MSNILDEIIAEAKNNMMNSNIVQEKAEKLQELFAKNLQKSLEKEPAKAFNSYFSFEFELIDVKKYEATLTNSFYASMSELTFKPKYVTDTNKNTHLVELLFPFMKYLYKNNFSLKDDNSGKLRLEYSCNNHNKSDTITAIIENAQKNAINIAKTNFVNNMANSLKEYLTYNPADAMSKTFYFHLNYLNDTNLNLHFEMVTAESLALIKPDFNNSLDDIIISNVIEALGENFSIGYKPCSKNMIISYSTTN